MGVCKICGTEVTGIKRHCPKCLREKQMKAGNEYVRERSKAKNYYKNEVIYIYGGKCAICGWSIEYGNKKHSMQNGCDIHHIVEISKGGTDSIDNLIMLCPNHHREAHFNKLTIEQLRVYALLEPSKETRQERSRAAADCLPSVY